MSQLDVLYESHFNDPYYASKYFGHQRRIPLSILVVHYAVWKPTPGSDASIRSLASYFQSPSSTVSTSLLADVEGRCIRMLSLDHTPYTNGTGKLKNPYKENDRYSRDNLYGGWWLDHQGELSPYVNDMAFTVETCLWGDEAVDEEWWSTPTDAMYQVIAQRFLFILKHTPHTRIWRIMGHEHLAPDRKIDPGDRWDWERFFQEYMGVKPQFYKEYLSYLDETKYLSPSDKVKREICLENARKHYKDLQSKTSAVALV